jgi:hypothetical protein
MYDLPHHNREGQAGYSEVGRICEVRHNDTLGARIHSAGLGLLESSFPFGGTNDMRYVSRASRKNGGHDQSY